MVPIAREELFDRIERYGHDSVSHDCKPFTDILSRIGDKWSLLIIMLLSSGPRRFNELRRKVNGISQRMLTLTLRGLERDGFVSRKVYPTVPPRVEYALTELGVSVQGPVHALGEWTLMNQPRIEEAQRRFDAELANGQAEMALRENGHRVD